MQRFKVLTLCGRLETQCPFHPRQKDKDEFRVFLNTFLEMNSLILKFWQF